VSVIQTALISAGVAAFVTLLIEYFAKPALEARKERILANHRRRREALDRIDDALFVIGRLETYGGPEELDPLSRHIELAEEARTLLVNVTRDIDVPNKQMETLLNYAASRCYGACLLLSSQLALASPPPEFWKELSRSSDQLGDVSEYLRSGRWKRRGLARELQTRWPVDEVEPPPPVAPPTT